MNVFRDGEHARDTDSMFCDLGRKVADRPQIASLGAGLFNVVVESPPCRRSLIGDRQYARRKFITDRASKRPGCFQHCQDTSAIVSDCSVVLVGRFPVETSSSDTVRRRHKDARKKALVAQQLVGQELRRRLGLNHQMHGKPPARKDANAILRANTLDCLSVPNLRVSGGGAKAIFFRHAAPPDAD
jgi:hypothetical protein